MLPDEGAVVPLILDDAGQPLPADALGLHPLNYVVLEVTHGAGVPSRALGGLQVDAALLAGEGDGLVLLRHGVDGLAAHGALGAGSLGLVKDHVVAAMGAAAAGQLVRPHVDDVPAGTLDPLPGEEPRLRLHILPAYRAFDDKFRHALILLVDAPLIFARTLKIWKLWKAV